MKTVLIQNLLIMEVKDYWIEGEHYSYEDWKQKVEELNNPVKELTVNELSKLLGFK